MLHNPDWVKIILIFGRRIIAKMPFIKTSVSIKYHRSVDDQYFHEYNPICENLIPTKVLMRISVSRNITGIRMVASGIGIPNHAAKVSLGPRITSIIKRRTRNLFPAVVS